jgi:hypothetical protein
MILFLALTVARQLTASRGPTSPNAFASLRVTSLRPLASKIGSSNLRDQPFFSGAWHRHRP